MDGQAVGSARGGTSLWHHFLIVLGFFVLIQTLVLGYLFFGPVGITPFAFKPDANPDLTGPYTPNDALTRGRFFATRWTEPGEQERVRYRGVGPETVAVGPDGWLYTGLCDAGLEGNAPDELPVCRASGNLQGWVVRFDPKQPHSVEPYVKTGGRPLGLGFDAHGRLYIADALKGLLRVEARLSRPKGAHPETTDLGPSQASHDPLADAQPPADAVDARAEVRAPFHTVVPVATCNKDDENPDPQPGFADSLAIDRRGTVWFTCPSQRWPLAEIRNDIFEVQPTGRVVRYTPCEADDPLTCPKKVVADKLMFANGIAVWPGEGQRPRALLVNEWTGYRVRRLDLDARGDVVNWEPDKLRTDKERQQDEKANLFFNNTPGYPDNITIDADGTVWVGLVIRRQEPIDRLHPYPFLKSALARLPRDSVTLTRHAWVIGLSPEGKLLHNLQDTTGFFDQATGAYPVGDALYIATNTEMGVLCVKKPGARTDVDPCDPWTKRPPELAQLTVPETKGDLPVAETGGATAGPNLTGTEAGAAADAPQDQERHP